MSPEVTKRKIANMIAYLEELRAFAGVSFDDYVAHRRAVERLLTLLIQSAIDITSHLLADRAELRPDSYRDLFAAAADTGLLDRPQAQSLQLAAGLRNLLIHEYERIDDRQVWSFIPRAIKDFEAFLGAMKKVAE